MSDRLIRTAILPTSAGIERVDQAAAKLFPEFSRAQIQAWIRSGELLIDGQVAKQKDKATPGARIEIDANLAFESDRAEDIPLQICFEDDSVLIVNKPPGLVVHPGAGNPSGTLMNALMHYAPKTQQLPRAGIIHRLDKDTSGLLMVAKTLSAMTHMSRQLADRTIKREYEALVYGVPPIRGSIDEPIGRHPTQRTRMAVRREGRSATTNYWRLEARAGLALMKFSLVTGRTHQIRVHMEHIGNPLVGDPVYRKRRGSPVQGLPPLTRQALHARRIELMHPVSNAPLAIKVPAPQDFQALVEWFRTLDD